MRVYISGPITGRPDYRVKFADADRKLRRDGYTTINPAHLEKIMPADATHEEFMKICYPLLDIADAIYMLDGWEDSKGAILELKYARQKKIEVIFQRKHEALRRKGIK